MASYHLEIQTHRKSPVGIIRSSFREQGKVKHHSHGRLTGLPLQKLKLLQAAFRGDVLPKNDPNALQTLASKEYGASFAILAFAKQLGLHTTLYSRPQQWVSDCLAMIVGRILYAGSKLSLSHQFKNTALWELCGVEGSVDVDMHCYEAMDRLLERQDAIQRTLAAKHLADGHLVLYDITSSYLEGEYKESELVDFGYNRDGKKGHEQIVIGLLCSKEGCPVGVEVFRGNTKDSSTVMGKIAELRERYDLQKIIFVGDRGMITSGNIDQLKDIEGLATISALTHPQIYALIERKLFQPELFDEKQIAEVTDPEDPTLRYCLCRNPETARRETATRNRLMELTRVELDKIVASPRRSSPEKIGARVGKVLAKFKCGKFVEWETLKGKLRWTFKQEKIDAEKRLDGCYIVCARSVSKETMVTNEVVASYRKLALVESAFRNLKTVQLEVRPIYHKKDDRIRAHVFLCTLAYYVQWHMIKCLQPLFAKDGEGKNRQWSFKNVMERLKCIRRDKVRLSGVEFQTVGTPEGDQEEILQLLGVKLK
jgi:hypothetical protein